MPCNAVGESGHEYLQGYETKGPEYTMLLLCITAEAIKDDFKKWILKRVPVHC